MNEKKINGWCYTEGVPYSLEELGTDAWLTGCPLCGGSDCGRNLTPEQKSEANEFFDTLEKIQAEKEEFNFVIGRKEESGYIGVYAYGTEVHFGTIVEARKFLKHLEKISESKSEAKKYKIYRIDPTPVE